MGDLSVAVLVGRLTRDAELKYTNSGQAVCHFSVATGSRVKKGDQWVDESSFWDVDLWGKRAESVNQYLTKGKLVAVQGDMRQDKWEQDGQSRMKVKITANDVQLLGGQGGPGGGQGGGQGGYERQGQSQGGYDRGPSQGGYDRGAPQQGRGSYGAPQGAPRQGGGRESAPPSDDFTDDIPF
ncbi:MAG: single-stranded DNA-binding protein [Spirochaetaceae bacterium]|nr:single-stranded DNA-binding protein [Spirochaetaceae bacterium]